MSNGGDNYPKHCEHGNLQAALSTLAVEATAASGRRLAAADQLASDSQRMWSIAMTSPTISAAHGARILTESGSGHARQGVPQSGGSGG